MGVVYLIRHGQASFGKANYDQLSAAGVAQSQRLGTALQGRLPKVDAVYCGTLQRHRDTARHALQAMGLQLPIQERADLNEFDHDEVMVRHTPRYASRALMMAELALTLEPRRAFQRFFAQAVERWVSGQHDADYAESWPAFQQRSRRAVREIVAELGASKTALVFTSGGPITAVAQDLLQVDNAHAFALNWVLVNCGVTKLIYGERGLHLSSFNDHSHLEGPSGESRSLITYR